MIQGNGDRLHCAVQTLQCLPPENQDTVLALIEQLARAVGMKPVATELPLPIVHVGVWITKLKSEHRAESTIYMYRYIVKRFLNRYPRPTRLDVQSYLTERLELGVSTSAVNNERKALSGLFRFLQEEGLVHRNPTEGVNAIKAVYSERKPPRPEAIQKAMDVHYLRPRDAYKMRTIIVLLMTTGLRLSEALGLRKESINFEAMEMTVVGKGGKRRVVPLLPVTKKALSAYIAKNQSDSPYVFPGRSRSGHAAIYNIEKTMKRACLRAGIEPFTPHQLRHYFATEMLRGGAKLEVVGRILGHSSIGITADIYRHVLTDEMHEAVRMFGPMNGRDGEVL